MEEYVFELVFRLGMTFWTGFFWLVSSKTCLGLERAEFRGVGSDLDVAIREGHEWCVGVFGSVL